MTQISDAAKVYLDGGLSLIPINKRTKRPAWWLLPQKTDKDGNPLFSKPIVGNDGATVYIETTEDTGSPKGAWEPYQQRRATATEVDRWLKSGIQSIAIVGGAVSGGAEVLDFDMRNGENWYQPWVGLAGDPVKEHGLALQRTGSGGFQVGFRSDCSQGNQKLAWVPAPEEKTGKKVMIETRGEGGYFLVAPSAHPSGNHYELLHGRFSKMRRIDTELRTFLLDCARQLNQVEMPEPKRNSSSASNSGDGNNEVADAYNKKYPIDVALLRYGYTQHGNRWSRPGKADSMGLVVFDDGKAYAFSSNDAMAADRCGVGDNRPFTSFDLFAYYDHDEDYSAATKAAAIELGMAYESNLHTLLYVEGYDNAAVARDLMFQHGWVVRGFRADKINLDGVSKYSNIIVWSYKDALAKHIAGTMPGALPLVVPSGMDAQAMDREGILQPYLEAVLADAKNAAEVMTWTL